MKTAFTKENLISQEPLEERRKLIEQFFDLEMKIINEASKVEGTALLDLFIDWQKKREELNINHYDWWKNLCAELEQATTKQPITEGQTVYRKVFVKDRLPTEKNTYFTGWDNEGKTIIIGSNYFNGKLFEDDEDTERYAQPDWYIEETTLPLSVNVPLWGKIPRLKAKTLVCL